MDIIITINTDNAAFDGSHRKFEVARILQELVNTIKRNGIYEGTLRDVNGNTVCKVEVA